MKLLRRIGILIFVSGLTIMAAQLALAKKEKPSSSSQMDERKRASHALNRLAFGPRPGDVDRVTAIGVDKWIDLQLHPEKINDDALESRLTPLRTLRMDTREMAEKFPSQQEIRAVANGKMKMPSGGPQHAVYMAQMERYEEKLDQKKQSTDANPGTANTDTAAQSSDQDKDKDAARNEMRQKAEPLFLDLVNQPADQRFKAILKMPVEDQAALASLGDMKRDELLDGMTAEQRETILALKNPQQVVSEELMQGKLLHAIYGERQLQEVMTDFWFNHFNVFIGKGPDRYMLTSYERDVIRPHSMGKFEDLLVATAKSPAMLFYLDNWLSVGPDSRFALGISEHPDAMWGRRRFPRQPRLAKAAKRSGLNENYGRELMELHTLGVNGGYTQKDVTEVARVFTGWTLKEPREGGGYFFDDRKHAPGDKTVLGHRIKMNGEKEGLEVLRLLARNPATAHFVCNKLAMRFVSDNPPSTLVDRMAQTYLKKDGDIREVLKTLFSSPEFWAPEAYRAKVKTPLEFVVSAVRASGADVTNAMPLARQLQNMGMQLYGAQPPTGYSMKAETWVNSSALLARMNFSLALASGKMRGVSVDTGKIVNGSATDSSGVLAALESNLLNGEVSKQTHDTIAARLEDPAITQRKFDDPTRPANVGMIEGLLLGSPEFQKR